MWFSLDADLFVLGVVVRLKLSIELPTTRRAWLFDAFHSGTGANMERLQLKNMKDIPKYGGRGRFARRHDAP